MSITFPKVFFAFAATLFASGAAFSGAFHKIEQTNEHAAAMVSSKLGKKMNAIRTIEVTMGDSYFETEKLLVKVGETIRFVVENEGDFLHEFSLGTAATHAEHQKEMMTMVELDKLTKTDIDRITMKMNHPSKRTSGDTHVNSNSILVEPGKTQVLVWKFTKSVDLEFACNLPGHYEAGMMGKIELVVPSQAGS